MWNIEELKKCGFTCTTCLPHIGKKMDERFVFETGRKNLYVSGGAFGNERQKVLNPMDVYFNAAAGWAVQVRLCSGFRFNIPNAYTELGTRCNENEKIKVLTINDLKKNGFLCRNYQTVSCEEDGTLVGKNLKAEYIFKTGRNGLYISGSEFGDKWYRISNSLEVYYRAAANCPIEVKLCNGFEFRINNACTELGTESREAGTADTLTIKDLREKGFLCRDYETVSYSEDGSCSGINMRHEFVFTAKNGRLYVSEDSSGSAGQEVANPFEVYCKAAMHFGSIPVKLCNGKEFRINSAKAELTACGSPDGKKGEQK